MMPMPILLEGYGSAGQRHAQALTALGHPPAIISRRAGMGPFTQVRQAVIQAPEAVLLVSSETARHRVVIQEALEAGHLGPLVVEKPIAMSLADLEAMNLPADRPVFVTYNLRFHPAIEALRVALGAQRPLSVSLHVGQDLDRWRPDRPTSLSYSAHASQGGGVLRDLSHELDLVDHLFGPVVSVSAAGGRLGPEKTVDSDDCWTALAQTATGPAVALSLNYYDQPPRRVMHITTTGPSLTLDLIAGTLAIGERSLHLPCPAAQHTTGLWQDLLVHWQTGAPSLCADLASARRTLAVIDAMERSARAGGVLEAVTEPP